MYKRILVAVDGSDTSNLALNEGIKLAKDQHATLRLIHVVEETPAYLMADVPYAIEAHQKAMRETGRKELAACAAKVKSARVKFDTKFVVIDPLKQRIYDVINKEAKRWPADLIVTGTHGRRGFKHLFLGSVAEGIIRLAAKPTLVIHGR